MKLDEPLFHAGEVALQREAGVAERMARIGAQVIRDHLPEQHRLFFPLLPFLVVGSLDARGQPQASLLGGEPGFVSSPDPKTLRVEALPRPGDPLAEQLHDGAPLGLLGIQPHTARRNRANGRVRGRDASGFSLSVSQSFGNCPKYIVRRQAFYVGASSSIAPRVSERLGERERSIVAAADTFFIASAHPDAAAASERAHGVDVSHRGGPRGFAAFVDDDTFVIADFRGNDLYNTLGNLRLQPAAGLLFIDVDRGDVLQLEARADVVTGAHPLSHPAASGSRAGNVEEVSNVEMPIGPGSTRPSPAQRGRGEPGTHRGHERLVRFQVQRSRLFPAASGLLFHAPLPG